MGDSGPGIDAENLERVFEAFYTTKSGGLGIGLSICRSIIEAHGGRLWADANEPRGAVFQFTLPGAENQLTDGEAARRHRIKWRWVKGHKGDPANERADALANLGAVEHG